MYGTEKIADILERRVESMQLARPIEATRVCQAFVDAILEVNVRVAEKVEPIHLKNKTLLVSVPSSVWANELLMCQHIVVKKINMKLNDGRGGHKAHPYVERIRYEVRR